MGAPFAQKTGFSSLGDDQKEGTDVRCVTKYFTGDNCAVEPSIFDASSRRTYKEQVMLYQLLDILALQLYSLISSLLPSLSLGNYTCLGAEGPSLSSGTSFCFIFHRIEWFSCKLGFSAASSVGEVAQAEQRKWWEFILQSKKILCESEFQFTPHRITGNSWFLPQVSGKTKWASEITNIHVFPVPSGVFLSNVQSRRTVHSG